LHQRLLVAGEPVHETIEGDLLRALATPPFGVDELFVEALEVLGVVGRVDVDATACEPEDTRLAERARFLTAVFCEEPTGSGDMGRVTGFTATVFGLSALLQRLRQARWAQ